MGLEQDLSEICCLREKMVHAYQQEDFVYALEVSQELDELIIKVQKDFGQNGQLNLQQLKDSISC